MDLKEKISQLEEKLKSVNKDVKSKDSCFPTLMVVGVAIPFVLLLLLFFLQPSFVQKKEGNAYIRDGKKIFYWTLAISLISWVCLYLYSYCIGYNNASMVCAR